MPKFSDLFHSTKDFNNTNTTILGYLLFMCIFLHILFAAIFFITDIKVLAIYNIFSSFYFTFLLYLNHIGKTKIAAILGILEINLYLFLAVAFIGWESGIQQFIFALVICTFFQESLSFRGKIGLNLISMCVFIGAWIWSTYSSVFKQYDPQSLHMVNLITGVSTYLIITGLCLLYERMRQNLKDMLNNNQKINAGLKSILENNLKIGNKITIFGEKLSSAFNTNYNLQNKISEAIENIAEASKINSKENISMSDRLHSFSRMFEELAASMNQVYMNSSNIVKLNKQGDSFINELACKLEDNALQTQNLSASIRDMSDKAKEIRNITSVMNQISEQTSLISLNATIEAARAGESGKGFYVVAREIGKLAEQSHQSLEQIEAVINNVEESVAKAIINMQEVEKIVETQKQLSDKTTGTFRDIANEIGVTTQEINVANKDLTHIGDIKNDIINLVDNITSLLQETTSSIEQISLSMKEQNSSMSSANSILKEFLHLSSELEKAPTVN